jgi:hypothetical protein
MPIPIIGIISSVLTGLGVFGLVWYWSLTKDEREKADRLAGVYAFRLYNKALDQLTKAQVTRVYDLVKSHFVK